MLKGTLYDDANCIYEYIITHDNEVFNQIIIPKNNIQSFRLAELHVGGYCILKTRTVEEDGTLRFVRDKTNFCPYLSPYHTWKVFITWSYRIHHVPALQLQLGQRALSSIYNLRTPIHAIECHHGNDDHTNTLVYVDGMCGLQYVWD